MARDNSKLVTIPGELHSVATGNIVAAAEEVFDYTTNKYQKDINQEVVYIKEDSSVAPIPSFDPQSQTVHLDEQVLSNTQKKQVRKNIGFGDGNIDSTPTSGSDNVVRSGGVYSSMQELRSTVNQQVGYYTCSTAGNTAAKVIDASGYTLLKGGGLRVNFTEKNTAANATLNINDTGAKDLYYNGVRVSTNNSWYAGEIATLFYDGAAFQLNSLPDLDEYDVSARNGGQAFTFDEAVALVPEAYRHGGLKLRFIFNSESGQSSDNKYHQYRLLAEDFSTNVNDWEGEDETLLRMQGISENYDGLMDPVLRKMFSKDLPEGADEYKYSVKQANDFLNEEYFAIKDDKYYRGQENGVPREIDDQEINSICRNIVHIDISGACVWVMNMPYTYATGSFRQIAFGVAPYSSTEAGYEVTNGITAGSQVLQRISSYDWNTGEVTWSEWKSDQAIETLQLAIDTINGKIPSQATPQNQLADKKFVQDNIKDTEILAQNLKDIYLGTSLGNLDDSTPYLEASVSTALLSFNMKAIISFYNFNNTQELWYSWLVRVTTPSFQNIIILRNDAYEIIQGSSAGITHNFNWNTFKDDMYGAKVDLEISYTKESSEGTDIYYIDITANITTRKGVEYHETFKKAVNISAYYVYLSLEHSHLYIISPFKTESITTAITDPGTI